MGIVDTNSLPGVPIPRFTFFNQKCLNLNLKKIIYFVKTTDIDIPVVFTKMSVVSFSSTVLKLDRSQAFKEVYQPNSITHAPKCTYCIK